MTESGLGCHSTGEMRRPAESGDIDGSRHPAHASDMQDLSEEVDESGQGGAGDGEEAFT